MEMVVMARIVVVVAISSSIEVNLTARSVHVQKSFG